MDSFKSLSKFKDYKNYRIDYTLNQSYLFSNKVDIAFSSIEITEEDELQFQIANKEIFSKIDEEIKNSLNIYIYLLNNYGQLILQILDEKIIGRFVQLLSFKTFKIESLKIISNLIYPNISFILQEKLSTLISCGILNNLLIFLNENDLLIKKISLNIIQNLNFLFNSFIEISIEKLLYLNILKWVKSYPEIVFNSLLSFFIRGSPSESFENIILPKLFKIINKFNLKIKKFILEILYILVQDSRSISKKLLFDIKFLDILTSFLIIGSYSKKLLSLKIINECCHLGDCFLNQLKYFNTVNIIIEIMNNNENDLLLDYAADFIICWLTSTQNFEFIEYLINKIINNNPFQRYFEFRSLNCKKRAVIALNRISNFCNNFQLLNIFNNFIIESLCSFISCNDKLLIIKIINIFLKLCHINLDFTQIIFNNFNFDEFDNEDFDELLLLKISLKNILKI